MRSKLILSWDDKDPCPMEKKILEAFNRVTNFCDELRSETSQRTAFNRITKNGEFDLSDVCELYRYAFLVQGRVVNAAYRNSPEVIESLLQAAKNLYDTMNAVVEHVVKHVKHAPTPGRTFLPTPNEQAG